MKRALVHAVRVISSTFSHSLGFLPHSNIGVGGVKSRTINVPLSLTALQWCPSNIFAMTQSKLRPERVWISTQKNGYQIHDFKQSNYLDENLVSVELER